MKKIIALLTALALLLTAFCAFSEGEDDPDDPAALIVNSHEMSRSELKDAATLYLFESALSCAGYGYGFDILDPLNIEDDMDKLVFELESWYTTLDLAQSMGLYPLDAEAEAAAAQAAEETWQQYRAVAWSDDGMAYLPAGNYQYREDDPEGNITRYFASFGLTKEAVLEEAVRDQTHEELKKAVTAGLTDMTEDEIIAWFADWFLDKMDEQYIVEYDDVIWRVMDELAEDPTENQDGDGYEAYERSILIEDIYYTLGESTIPDFERNGWKWTRTEDGRFAFRVTEEGNYFYVKTDNGQPDGKLTMVDLFYAYDISYEYLGFGFDRAYNPDSETDVYTYIESIYGVNYTDEGVLQARTEVRGGTLLIEIGEGALRLTLETAD